MSSSPVVTTRRVPDLERHHRGDRRGDGGDDGERQRVHAGRQRRVALDELEVLGDEEDEAEEAEERHRDGEPRRR